MSTDRSAAHATLERFALPALLALAFAVRVREALRVPLWFDELYTLAAVSRPWADVMRVVRADVHPPLHFLYMHFWRLVGTGDLAVRASSLLLTLAVLGVTYALARELFGRGAALLALALVAVHPWHVYESQEARSYPMLWLWLALSWRSAWRWCEDGRRGDAIVFVLASALALWTHYLAGVLIAVQAAWGVTRLARTPRRLAAWVGLHAAVALLFAPLLPLMAVQFRRVETQHWLKPPRLAQLADTLRRTAYGSTKVLVPMLLLALWPFADPRARRASWFAFAIGPLALLVCWVLGTRGIRVFAFKYMLFAVPPVMALVAAGVARLPGRVTRWAVAAVLVASGAWALAMQPPYAEAVSWRSVRARLGDRVRAGDVIFTADSHAFLFTSHDEPQARQRLLPMAQVIPYFEGRAVLPDSAFADASELREAAAAHRRWWAVAWGRGGVNDRAFSACADSFADARPDTCGLAHVWSGVRAR